MEKFYIVTPESPVHKDYQAYKEMSEKINAAFKEFAKENDIDTPEYYQRTDRLHICPTGKDKERFERFFQKTIPGCFKKNSQLSKRWLQRCVDRELETPRRPNLGMYFRFFGKCSSRILMINNILYASFESDDKFQPAAGFVEIKASEFYGAIEEYKESLSK